MYIGSSHSPYVVADLKLLDAALAKITCCHGCGSKMSSRQDLDQRQSIGTHLKLYCGSIKHTTVKKSKDNFTPVLLKKSITLSIQLFVLPAPFCLLIFPLDRVFITGTSYQTLQTFC